MTDQIDDTQDQGSGSAEDELTPEEMDEVAGGVENLRDPLAYDETLAAASRSPTTTNVEKKSFDDSGDDKLGTFSDY